MIYLREKAQEPVAGKSGNAKKDKLSNLAAAKGISSKLGNKAPIGEKLSIEQEAERLFNVKYKDKNANDVNFTDTFQQGLPQDAIDLKLDIEELLKKDQAKYKDVPEIVAKFMSSKEKIIDGKSVFTGKNAVSAKMMASELLYEHFKLNQY